MYRKINTHLNGVKSKINRESLYYKRKFVDGSLTKLHDNAISQISIEVRPLWKHQFKSQFHRTKVHSKYFNPCVNSQPRTKNPHPLVSNSRNQ